MLLSQERKAAVQIEDEKRHGARAEWARGWPLVLSCTLGVSVIGVAPYSLGQFMAPLEHAFGWSRTEVTAGLAMGIVFGFALGPFIGRFVDRRNVRTMVLLGLILAGVALAGLSLANRSFGSWIALWSLLNVAGALIGPTVWVSVIAGTFKKGRSLAMSVALGGTALSSTFAPMISRELIDAFGWRIAWQLLGVIWPGIVLLMAIPFFIDRRQHADTFAFAASSEQVTPFGKLLGSSIVLRLAMVMLAAMTVVSGMLIHLAPAFVDQGFAPASAARIAGLAGLMFTLGKIYVGLLFDRFPAKLMSVSVMAILGLASLTMLVAQGTVPGAILAAGTIGTAAGALLALIACLIARLFAPRDFGTVFGVMMSMASLGGGLGPLLASAVHDHTGSYHAAFSAGLGVAILCMFVLGSLPYVGRVSDEPIAH